MQIRDDLLHENFFITTKIFSGHKEIVQRLIERGAVVDTGFAAAIKAFLALNINYALLILRQGNHKKTFK